MYPPNRFYPLWTSDLVGAPSPVIGSTGGGVRVWRPKRHFLFLISLPEMKLEQGESQQVSAVAQLPHPDSKSPRAPFPDYRSLWLLSAERSWEERSPLGVSES